MNKFLLAMLLAIVGVGLAAQAALAVEEETYVEDVGTTWGCIKKISTSNPCPIPDDPPDKGRG